MYSFSEPVNESVSLPDIIEALDIYLYLYGFRVTAQRLLSRPQEIFFFVFAFF